MAALHCKCEPKLLDLVLEGKKPPAITACEETRVATGYGNPIAPRQTRAMRRTLRPRQAVQLHHRELRFLRSGWPAHSRHPPQDRAERSAFARQPDLSSASAAGSSIPSTLPRLSASARQASAPYEFGVKFDRHHQRHAPAASSCSTPHRCRQSLRWTHAQTVVEDTQQLTGRQMSVSLRRPPYWRASF